MSFQIVIINNMYIWDFKKSPRFLLDELKMYLWCYIFFYSYNVVVSCGKDYNHHSPDEENL